MASIRRSLAHEGVRRIRWTYALFVTTLAVFLVSLPLIGLRYARFESTAVIGGPGAGAARAAALAAAGASPEDIAAVAVKLEGSESSGSPSPELAKRLAGAVRFDYLGSGAAVGASGLAVHLTWNQGSATVTGVNELAKQIVVRENAQRLRALNESRRAARDERDRLKVEREDILGRLMPLRAQIAIERARAATSNDPRKSQPDRALPPPRPTPEKSTTLQLRDELERLQAQRNRLLEKFTAEHPDVQFLSTRVVELQEQLKRTAPPRNAPDNETVHDTPSAVPQEKPEPTRLEESGLRLVEAEALLVRQLTECEQNLRAAAARAEETERALAEHEERPPWQYRAAATFRRLRNDPEPERLALTWLMSVAAGVLVAFALVGLRPVVESLWDARARLDVPIVGVVPAAADAPPRIAPASRIWAGRATKVAELSLLALVVLVATTAFIDHDFAVQLAADPVDAWSSVVARLRQ
ncbi:MAG: hypothetical protein WD468_02355 [Pirellulales bacterium]